MHKISTFLIATTLASSVGVVSADAFMERRDILAKATSSAKSKVEVGFYPGDVEQSSQFYWAHKFLPFTNYISDQTGNVISLVPEQNVTVLKNLVKAQHYKWLYVSSSIAVLAQGMGYTPVVKAGGDTDSVFVTTPKSSIHKLTDLQGVRVGIASHTEAALVAKYTLKNVKPLAISPIYVEAGSSLRGQLPALLDSGVVDAVIISREQADVISKIAPEKYKIADALGNIQGAVLLAHSSLSQSEIVNMRSAYLGLHLSDALHASLMSGYSFKSASNNYFIDFDRDYLSMARKVLAFNEPDYGRAVFDVKTQNWLESYQLFEYDNKLGRAKVSGASALK
jgi:hypothetical protein